MRRGFSLLECMVSMTLFLVLILASFEFYSATCNYFSRLKERQLMDEAVRAALSKIRTDVGAAGEGLLQLIHLGLINGFSLTEGRMTIQSCESEFILSQDLIPGQTYIPLDDTRSIKKGQTLCVVDSSRGEVKNILAVDAGGVVLGSPLQLPYAEETVRLILIRQVAIYLDTKKHILRRKVNTSPAQPLMEDTASFQVKHDAASHLVFISIAHLDQKEKPYETVIFNKNPALAQTIH